MCAQARRTEPGADQTEKLDKMFRLPTAGQTAHRRRLGHDQRRLLVDELRALASSGEPAARLDRRACGKRAGWVKSPRAAKRRAGRCRRTALREPRIRTPRRLPNYVKRAHLSFVRRAHTSRSAARTVSGDCKSRTNPEEKVRDHSSSIPMTFTGNVGVRTRGSHGRRHGQMQVTGVQPDCGQKYPRGLLCATVIETSENSFGAVGPGRRSGSA